MKLKYCQLCKNEENLLINSKYINKKGKINYQYMCKGCTSDRARKYRTTEKGKEVYREIMKKQYQNHKQKVCARQALNYHVKKGRVIKPDKCECCGEIKKVDGHHEDYTKPLLIKWLCRQCHSIV